MLLLVHLCFRLINVLLRDHVPGVDLQPAKVLYERLPGMPLLFESFSMMHMQGGGGRPHTFHRQLVTDLSWSFVEGHPICLIGGFKVLSGFCGFTPFVKNFCRLRACNPSVES